MDKEVGEKMIQVCQSLTKMLEMTFQAFKVHETPVVKEAMDVKNEIQHHVSALTQLLVSKSSAGEKGKEWAKPYLSMASSFDRMAFNIEGILDRLDNKIQNQILFSDRAVKEVNDVFQEAMNLLENLPDLILTQNKLLAQRIGEAGRAVFKIANGYSEDHEQRLIQGVCMPKSSPIYLALLECLKGIVAHTLEVSGKIVTLSSKS